MDIRHIPLFPLGVVLFPGGHLPLRIFEQRYLGMVRDCSRDNSTFGIVAVLPALPGDTGGPLAPVGTLAQITDFYSTADGLLGISTLGMQRFRVGTARADGTGLLRADVMMLEEAGSHPVPPQYGLLARLVHSLVEQVGGPHAQSTPAQRDDALWVARRLAEFLPLDLAEKQQLLELDDAEPQLHLLLDWLPRFQAD